MQKEPKVVYGNKLRLASTTTTDQEAKRGQETEPSRTKPKHARLQSALMLATTTKCVAEGSISGQGNQRVKGTPPQHATRRERDSVACHVCWSSRFSSCRC